MATPPSERLLAIIELQNAIAAAALNADEVMRVVAERAALLTEASGGLVAIVEADELVVRAVGGTTKTPLGTRQARDTTLSGRAFAERKPLHADEGAAVPLFYGESVVGVIEVTGGKSGAKADAAKVDADHETLRLLGAIIAIALHRAYTYPRPRFDNQHDALTGLGNRHAFEERIAAELGRNKRYGHSFSLTKIDLAGLETANDRFGQATADETLRVIANILKRHTRVIDACFRIAADELAIVMPGTSLEGARIVADRCRAQITEANLCEGTINPRFGIVEADDADADALLARASAALVS